MSVYSLTGWANLAGYDKTFTNEYDTNQTALTILTPTTGTSLSVKGVYINTAGSAGMIRLYFPTSGNTIYITFGANEAGYVPLLVEGQRNEVVKMTSTLGADQLYFVLINYTEK